MIFLLWIIWGGKTHLKSGPPFLVVAFIKDMEEGSFGSLPASSHSSWPVDSSTEIWAYFFGIIMNIEDQLRHPVLWTKQLLGSWTFH